MGVVFGSPFYGYLAPIDSADEVVLPKKEKTILYLGATLAGFFAYIVLSDFFGSSMALPSFETISIGRSEMIALLPLILVSCLFGYSFLFFGKMVSLIFEPIKNNYVLTATIGGLILGITGIFFPYTMFSGESQVGQLQQVWQTMSFGTLFLSSFLKILIISICINTGWKGGTFFPLIFSGVSLGFSAAVALNLDGTFCAALATAALLGTIIRKPLSVVFLLMLCFPIKAILPMAVAACIGSYIPISKSLISQE